MRSPVARHFGRVLREHRVAAGLGQAELGLKVSASQPTVSAWERGFQMPDFATIIDLADILGFSLDQFREVAA
jgi:transcriptional regulator with XRE-family HTH domain